MISDNIIQTQAENRPAFALSEPLLIERRINRVDVFLVELLRREPQSFTEGYKMETAGGRGYILHSILMELPVA